VVWFEKFNWLHLIITVNYLCFFMLYLKKKNSDMSDLADLSDMSNLSDLSYLSDLPDLSYSSLLNNLSYLVKLYSSFLSNCCLSKLFTKKHFVFIFLVNLSTHTVAKRVDSRHGGLDISIPRPKFDWDSVTKVLTWKVQDRGLIESWLIDWLIFINFQFSLHCTCSRL